jgi:uncharacterized membrane protein
MYPLPVLPSSPIENVLDALGAVLVLATILIPVFTYGSLPDRIPTHFGISGVPNGWGGRQLVFLFPAISVVVFAGLTAAIRFPRFINFPFRITQENAVRQFRLIRLFLAVLKTLTAALFMWIEFMTVQVATGKTAGLGAGFLFVFLALIFGTTIIYFAAAFRSR